MSVVHVTLDTRAPKVTLPSIRDIDPPEVWDAVFEADEPLGPVSFSLADAAGVERRLGHEVIGDTIIVVRVPTTTLLQGPATLWGTVADEVCNVTPVEVPLHIMGEIGYEAVLTMERAFSASVVHDQSYEAEATTSRAYRASLEMMG